VIGGLLLGLVAGALVAAVTTPVAVSGAIFLLPIQLSVLGALLRYRPRRVDPVTGPGRGP
jgi:hypothetical protein